MRERRIDSGGKTSAKRARESQATNHQGKYFCDKTGFETEVERKN
jgi:hypothetical protein